MRNLIILGAALLLLAACGADTGEATAVPPTESGSTGGMNMMNGMGSGMMARHMAPIPEAYAGLTNPRENSETVLEQGATLYTTYCATCHGDDGMGDGPAATNLDPAPAAIAHTSQMLGDDYLFWRISEGGQADPFNSVMPAWKNSLSESERWALITYIRDLGSSTPVMGHMQQGIATDANAEATRQAEMLAQGVAQDVITKAEADLFARIHILIEGQMTSGMQRQGNMSQMQTVLLAQLVDLGSITQAEADQFSDIHDRLVAGGLMQ